MAMYSVISPRSFRTGRTWPSETILREKRSAMGEGSYKQHTCERMQIGT